MQMEHFFSPNSGEEKKRSLSKIEHFFFPNSGEDQIKNKNKQKKRSSSRTEHFFFPNSGEDQTKKKVFIKNRALFSPNFRSDVNPLKILGGMQMWTILKLLGEIYPPQVLAPLSLNHVLLEIIMNKHLILIIQSNN